MSAWVEGKLELICSLDILRRAIINIHPEWENHLIVDPEGNIPMYRYNKIRSYHGEGGDKNVHLCIPGSGHPGVDTPPNRHLHNDWGFKKSEDGKWEVTFADFGLEEANSLKERIVSEVSIMKVKAIAKMRNFQILSEEENEDEKCINIRIDSDAYGDLA